MNEINDGGLARPVDGMRQLAGRELLWSRFRAALTLLRQRLPYLVWHGQNVQVVVTFTEPGSPDMEIRQLPDGSLNPADIKLRPIEVRFLRPAKRRST